MARITTPVAGTVISTVAFGEALRNDYVSQTDAVAQEVASAINFTNATVTKSGTALATTTNVSDHAALTTGVHGVGAGTVAKTADIIAYKLSPTYIGYMSGGVCYAEDANGSIVSSNANADVVINALRAANPHAFLRFKQGTYPMTNPMVFSGVPAGDWTDPLSKFRLWGDGYGTIFDISATANKDGIQFNDGACVDLRDFTLKLPDANSGHGINGLDTGGTRTESCIFSYLDGIHIKGCDATHYGLRLQNPFYTDIGYIKHAGASAAGSFMFESSKATFRGNMHIRHLDGYAPAGATLSFWAHVNGGLLNFIKLERLETSSSLTGINLKTENNGNLFNLWLEGIDLEATDTQILFDPAQDTGGTIANNIFRGYMTAHSAKTSIDANDGYGHGDNLFDLNVYLDANGATTKIVNDGHVGAYRPANEYRLKYNGGEVLTVDQFTVSSTPPKFSWGWIEVTTSTTLKNPNSGATANVSDGGTITHKVGLTPTWAIAVGSVAGEVVAVTAKSATTLTVAIKKISDGSAGTAQTIYWRAGYNSD